MLNLIKLKDSNELYNSTSFIATKKGFKVINLLKIINSLLCIAYKKEKKGFRTVWKEETKLEV